MCRNPSFGLATKARGCKVAGAKRRKEAREQGQRHWKGAGQEEEARESKEVARECEGVNTHTPKATPILGEGVPVDSRNFRGRVEGSNLNGLLRSLYRWKALETQMSKMGSHCAFGHLKGKLWAKEGPGVKLAIWLTTTKGQESTSSRHPICKCDMALRSSRRGL
jgi:hypothetical protein